MREGEEEERREERRGEERRGRIEEMRRCHLSEPPCKFFALLYPVLWTLLPSTA